MPVEGHVLVPQFPSVTRFCTQYRFPHDHKGGDLVFLIPQLREETFIRDDNLKSVVFVVPL